MDHPSERSRCVRKGPREVHFTDVWCINRDRRDHMALDVRVSERVRTGRSTIARERIRCIRGDANVELTRVLDAIHPNAYVFVFADMEAPKQCHWVTIEALRTHRQHKSVDLYMLFPLDMALKRLVSRNPVTVAQSARVLNAFFGDDRWRSVLHLRQTGSDADKDELGRALINLYVERLRNHWAHVEMICDVRRGMHHKLYKMLYASDNLAGKKIAAWAKRRAQSQGELTLGP